MAMSEWMESVTGRTNESHQSWRDNYNGGRPAGSPFGGGKSAVGSVSKSGGGDKIPGKSGGTSAKRGDLDPIRVAPGGKKPGAPESPRQPAAQGAAKPAVGGQTPQIVTGVQPSVRAGGGLGSILPMLPSGGWLKPVVADEATGLYAGLPIHPNPRFSDAAEWEQRYAEVGELLGGLVVLGGDIGYNLRESLWPGQPTIVERYQNVQRNNQPLQGGNGWKVISDAVDNWAISNGLMSGWTGGGF